MGCEGLLGHELLLGSDRLTSGYLMQGEVSGIVVARQHLEQLMRRDNELAIRILELAVTQMNISRQLTACSLTHETDQRLARSLLLTSHLLGSPTLKITQDALGRLLAVGRPSICSVSKVYERDGLTRTQRGTLTITDRDGLAERSCECYRALVDLISASYRQGSRNTDAQDAFPTDGNAQHPRQISKEPQAAVPA